MALCLMMSGKALPTIILCMYTSVSSDLPYHWFVAGVVNDHLDGQCIVDIDEEGVGLIAIKPSSIHLGQSTNEGGEVCIFAASTYHTCQSSFALSIALQHALILTEDSCITLNTGNTPDGFIVDNIQRYSL